MHIKIEDHNITQEVEKYGLDYVNLKYGEIKVLIVVHRTAALYYNIGDHDIKEIAEEVVFELGQGTATKYRKKWYGNILLYI